MRPRPAGLYSEIEYAICRLAFEKREWENAVRHCGLSANETNHERARKMLGQLAARTRRLYLEGYVMEGIDPDAALRRYREALRSAPPGDPFGAKAGRKMKAIEGVRRH